MGREILVQAAAGWVILEPLLLWWQLSVASRPCSHVVGAFGLGYGSVLVGSGLDTASTGSSRVWSGEWFRRC